MGPPKGGGPEGGAKPRKKWSPKGGGPKFRAFVPTRPGRRGSHTTARELQTCTFQGTCASKHHQNSTRRPPERHRNSETVAGKGRKSAKFWAPHPSGPHLRGHPLGAPPFGPTFSRFGQPTHRGSTLRGPTLSGPHPFGAPPFWAPTLLGGAPMGETLKH